MNRLRIHRKETFYLGIILIAVGILLRWLIERTLVSDGQIESSLYRDSIFVFQILVIVVGAFLVLRQPAIRPPKRSEIVLVLFSTLMTFLLLEMMSRVWLNYLATPDQYDRYVLFTSLDSSEYAWMPHPYLGYYPNPNYRKGQTSHNSLGYRSDEFPLEKPDGVYRIVALGGSSTYDVSIKDNQKTFTAQLEKLLKDEYGYQNVQVINAGVPGYNSWEILANLEFRVLDLDPDLVIIYENTNDVHARLVLPAAYQSDDLGRRQAWQVPDVALWEHSALLRILSRSLNITRQVSVDDFASAPTYVSWPFESRLEEFDLDPAEILRKNPPVYFRRNLENMIAVAKEHDVKILFSTWAYSPYLHDYASEDYYQEGFRENNDVVREVASSHAIPLFDFVEVMPKDAKYWADGRHVNEAGALVKARLFAEFVDAQGLIEK
ncbi:MAG TPA: SGNH/GDSL hydrolase family protein [Anaerolineales bacterium]|nr:SGNH/GDSL hydrolase family protein [Anaerolineales bacterium]